MLAVAVAGILVTAFGLVVRRFAPGSSALSVVRWLAAFALPAMALFADAFEDPTLAIVYPVR